MNTASTPAPVPGLQLGAMAGRIGSLCPMPEHFLTKSRYLAGLQCLRRVWLQVHAPPVSAAAAPAADAALEVEQAARRLFPGGVAAAGDAAQTACLLARPDVPAIFEAAFTHDGIAARADILARQDGGWALIEVKSSARVKPHYLDDVAVQAHVLRGAGVDVRGIVVLHLNKDYVRGAGPVDWQALFTRADVSAAIAARLPAVPGRIAELRHRLAQPAQPQAEPGGQCSVPYDCEFWDRCTADKPQDWVRHLPRLSTAQAEQLQALGIDAISAIPDDFPLNGKQTAIRDAIASGTPYVAPDLGRLLHGFGPPACYLDFEAMQPPIPLYPGTRPFQALPFQWSLHIAEAGDVLQHRAFLAPADADPRRAFAETLIAALSGPDWPVIVYSSYERTQLNQLAAQFPDLAAGLRAIAGRLADLLPVVRSAVYFPASGFSNSIKAVAPALCPGFGYDGLSGIADGAAAAAAFAQMASGAMTDPAEVSRVRAELLAYCRHDTLAMVEVHRALRRLC